MRISFCVNNNIIYTYNNISQLYSLRKVVGRSNKFARYSKRPLNRTALTRI